MGVEIITEMVEGFDLSEMNKYRWDAQYENIHLDSIPHRRLTKPVKVLEQSFNGEKKGRSRDTLIKLPVVEKGLMNAVVFWFDLHLDEEETLSNGNTIMIFDSCCLYISSILNLSIYNNMQLLGE